MIVLKFHQLVAELRPVMVIDQRQRPRDVFRIFNPGPSRKEVVDQLADGLAPSREPLFPAKTLKLL